MRNSAIQKKKRMCHSCSGLVPGQTQINIFDSTWPLTESNFSCHAGSSICGGVFNVLYVSVSQQSSHLHRITINNWEYCSFTQVSMIDPNLNSICFVYLWALWGVSPSNIIIIFLRPYDNTQYKQYIVIF